VHYAFGGGLGHLVRARAVRALLAPSERFVVLTSNPAVADPRVSGGFEVRTAPEATGDGTAFLREWVRATLRELRPRTFSVDAFPGGILGDLCGLAIPEGTRTVHVARLLRWDRYLERLPGPLPRYDQVLAVEPLAEAQEAALRERSGAWQDVDEPLEAVDPTAPQRALVRSWCAAGRPVWLVVHSGPLDEVRELVAWAREHAEAEGLKPRLVVASPLAPGLDDAGVERLDVHPVRALFPLVHRLVTAAGWNTMRETRPWRDRHLCLPFPRALDDQFARRRLAFPARTPQN